MTSQEKDKFICERLGLVWFTDPERTDYPDFTSEAGRVQLLKLVAGGVLNRYSFINDKGVWDLTYLMTDDTGKFRDEVFKWLGGNP